jgi:hypothetical protein
MEDARGLPLVYREVRPVISLPYSLLLPARRPQSLITTRFVSILEAQLEPQVHSKQGQPPAMRRI